MSSHKPIHITDPGLFFMNCFVMAFHFGSLFTAFYYSFIEINRELSMFGLFFGAVSVVLVCQGSQIYKLINHRKNTYR